MSWRIQGELWSGRVQAWAEWSNSLAGSVEALNQISLLEGDEVAVTPTGPWVDGDVTNEKAAYLMCIHVFHKPDVTGDPPNLDIPAVPDGAVA